MRHQGRSQTTSLQRTIHTINFKIPLPRIRSKASTILQRNHTLRRPYLQTSHIPHRDQGSTLQHKSRKTTNRQPRQDDRKLRRRTKRRILNDHNLQQKIRRRFQIPKNHPGKRVRGAGGVVHVFTPGFASLGYSSTPAISASLFSISLINNAQQKHQIPFLRLPFCPVVRWVREVVGGVGGPTRLSCCKLCLLSRLGRGRPSGTNSTTFVRMHTSRTTSICRHTHLSNCLPRKTRRLTVTTLLRKLRFSGCGAIVRML